MIRVVFLLPDKLQNAIFSPGYAVMEMLFKTDRDVALFQDQILAPCSFSGKETYERSYNIQKLCGSFHRPFFRHLRQPWAA